MCITVSGSRFVGILATKQPIYLLNAQKLSPLLIQQRSYSILLSGYTSKSKSQRQNQTSNEYQPFERPVETRKLEILFKSSMVRAKSSSNSSLASSTNDKTTPNSRAKETLSSSTKSLKSTSSLKSIGSSYFNNMRIIPVKALQDNYMYLLIDEASRQAAAVDPVNSSAMAEAIHDHGVDLKAILTTHHHYDHAHGNADMLGMFPEIIVYGGDVRVQALTKSVNHGDVIKLGSINIECLSTPCHTKGHICYYATCDADTLSSSSTGSSSQNVSQQQKQADQQQERAVFTGDTLFIAGCGRFFEGSSEQMDYNLNVLLGGLPSDTRVYCGHEYTVNNLKFALTVEPQNLDIKAKLNWAINKAAKKEPTVPSTIGEEKKINPFMRLKRPSVRKFTGETDELEVMTVLRHRKNEFQP